MIILCYLVAVLLIVGGIAGTILPVLPGAPMVFAGLLLASWITGFQHVGAVTLTLLGIMTIFSVAIDFIATALGAKKVGASRFAIIGAFVGTILGLFGGIVGIFLGPFVGAAIGEFIASENFLRAGQVGFATWLGMLVGTVVKLGVIFAMVGTFLIAWLI